MKISLVKHQVQKYFHSSSYEADLDLIIKALNVASTEDKDFSHIQNFRERTQAKAHYLQKQAALLVAAGAIAGAKKGILGGPKAMLSLSAKGASGALLVVSVTASGVMIRRALKGTSEDFTYVTV
jgi:hypothetical protein